MTSMELLELLGSVKDRYILEAHSGNVTSGRRVSIKRVLLVAAMIALALLLVGCTVAYVQGWFADFFPTGAAPPFRTARSAIFRKTSRSSGKPRSRATGPLC